MTTTGYRPPALDLAPFRAGTVWHYGGHAFMVTGMCVEEAARVVHRDKDSRVLGGPIEVTLDLREAELFADGAPQYRQLDDHGDGRQAVFFGAQAWRIVDVTVYEPTSGLRVRLFRTPYEDREADAVMDSGQPITFGTEDAPTLTAEWRV